MQYINARCERKTDSTRYSPLEGQAVELRSDRVERLQCRNDCSTRVRTPAILARDLEWRDDPITLFRGYPRGMALIPLPTSHTHGNSPGTRAIAITPHHHGCPGQPVIIDPIRYRGLDSKCCRVP